TAPIILPPLKAAGFDLIWFGVIMTIIMEMGLIHPPVGLNIFVIKNIAPEIPLWDVVWGVMPFVGLMMLAVVVLCIFPEIATWFPDAIMGAKYPRAPRRGAILRGVEFTRCCDWFPCHRQQRCLWAQLWLRKPAIPPGRSARSA